MAEVGRPFNRDAAGNQPGEARDLTFNHRATGLRARSRETVTELDGLGDIPHPAGRAVRGAATEAPLNQDVGSGSRKVLHPNEQVRRQPRNTTRKVVRELFRRIIPLIH